MSKKQTERSSTWEKNTARSMNKQELRKELKKGGMPCYKMCGRLTADRSVKICWIAYGKEADIIYAYSATRSEVSLQILIEDALERHSRIGMPKVFGDTMDFYVIRQLLDLKKEPFGILEPQADEKIF